MNRSDCVIQNEHFCFFSLLCACVWRRKVDRKCNLFLKKVIFTMHWFQFASKFNYFVNCNFNEIAFAVHFRNMRRGKRNWPRGQKTPLFIISIIDQTKASSCSFFFLVFHLHLIWHSNRLICLPFRLVNSLNWNTPHSCTNVVKVAGADVCVSILTDKKLRKFKQINLGKIFVNPWQCLTIYGLSKRVF